MMAYILDGVVILIFLLAVIIGYKRGFFQSAIQLVGCIAAVLVAFSLSAPLAAGIYDQFISDRMQKMMVGEITKNSSASVDAKLDQILKDLPDSVTNMLSAFHLGTSKEIANKLSASVSDTAAVLAEKIDNQIVRPVIVAVLRMLCGIVLFIVLMILLSILAKAIGRIFRLPVLRQMDGLLGAVFGAVQGVVLVFVAVTIISLIADTSDSKAKLTRAVVSHTVVVSTVENINPVSDLFQSAYNAENV